MNHKNHSRLSLPAKAFSLCLGALVLAAAPLAHAWSGNAIFKAAQQVAEPGSTVVAATGQVEYAFSPRGGGQALVLKAINSARSSILVMAYSFTSAPITRALLAAHARGVNVGVVVDYKENIEEDRSGRARAALSALANAGIAVRTLAAYPIAHDKVIIVDQSTVETGSFNYSRAAEMSNSENVIVLWNNPQLAHGFLSHWERNWQEGQPFKLGY
ncbi:MAG: phospholipase D family protein [Burkholderiaceae bacterium]|nr:MAG: phospholipase D family protein [Burkholderiaceae bacterium]TBR76845.1 MAG: phospholipase D family protein [Burkholderiaceae bacterium]